jgi:hypothetical protein
MVAVIAADGTALKPIIIVPCKTTEVEPILCGYNAQKVAFEYQENGFITIKLFEKWVEEVLLSDFSAVRMRTGYNSPAIVILDGCTCHAIEGIQGSLRANAYISPHCLLVRQIKHSRLTSACLRRSSAFLCRR